MTPVIDVTTGTVPAPVGIDTGAVLPTTASRPSLMTPFPLVRIRGRLTTGGARITLLTVRAPTGAHLAVRCIGRSCARRSWARATKLTRLSRFETRLKAGTRLEIRITRAGMIGKFTAITIRRGAPPLRRDRCLVPGRSAPTRCPGR